MDKNTIISLVIAILGSTIFANLITELFHNRHNSQDFSREISDKLLKNVFSKFHFMKLKGAEFDEARGKLKEFVAILDGERYAGYLAELREDAAKLTEIQDNIEFKRDYNRFKERYYKANITYQKKIGIKRTPYADNSLGITFGYIMGFLLIAVGSVMLEFGLNKKASDPNSLFYRVFGIIFVVFGALMLLIVLVTIVSETLRDAKIWWRHKMDDEGKLFEIVNFILKKFEKNSKSDEKEMLEK
ncbi:MAG: DUF308 domain-containing protein [Streptococcaceae bacterium]|jgi:hypothetical protein|nr:DUF308 domain-containing protein [Streptococcaceae bacterium]